MTASNSITLKRVPDTRYIMLLPRALGLPYKLILPKGNSSVAMEFPDRVTADRFVDFITQHFDPLVAKAQVSTAPNLHGNKVIVEVNPPIWSSNSMRVRYVDQNATTTALFLHPLNKNIQFRGDGSIAYELHIRFFNHDPHVMGSFEGYLPYQEGQTLSERLHSYVNSEEVKRFILQTIGGP